MTAATTRQDLPQTAEPVVKARQLSLRTKRGWVFKDVDLDLADGDLVAVTGPAGSGRSMLLLALTGRAKPERGTLSVAGNQRRAKIRQVTSVARITGAVELEGELRVGDHVREVALAHHREIDYRHAAELVGFTVDSATLREDLAPDEATLFAVALALTRRPCLVVVDDVDVAATVEQQRRIWAALADVARSRNRGRRQRRRTRLPPRPGARVLPLPVHGEYNEIPSEIPSEGQEDGSDATD